jgi:hypothetical protein
MADNDNTGTAIPQAELNPLLIALLEKMPSPEKGWPGPNRVRWFRTFAMNVSQIYDGDGDPIEMKIDLESGAAAPVQLDPLLNERA